MTIGYITIYRDELDSDKLFNEYCSLPNSVIDEEEDSVTFYTVSINDVPSEKLL